MRKMVRRCIVLEMRWKNARGSSIRMSHTLTETSFLNRVIRWDPASGRGGLEADARHVATVLRDLGWEKSALVVTLVGEVGRTSAAGRGETSERRGYHVVQVSYDAREQPVSGPSRLVICCRLSGTRGEKSHSEGPRGTHTCWTLLD